MAFAIIKRYNLALTADLYYKLKALSDSENSTMLDLIRRFIKIGLLIAEMGKDPTIKLMVHDDEKQTELKFII